MIILRTLSLSLSKKNLSKVGIYQFLLISLYDIDIYCIYCIRGNTLFLHPQLQLRLPSSDCSKSNETEWLSSWQACNTCRHPSGAYKLRNELVYGMFYGKRNFRQSICRSTGRSWTDTNTLMSLACRDLIINDHHYYQLSGSSWHSFCIYYTFSLRPDVALNRQ